MQPYNHLLGQQFGFVLPVEQHLYHALLNMSNPPIFNTASIPHLFSSAWLSLSRTNLDEILTSSMWSYSSLSLVLAYSSAGRHLHTRYHRIASPALLPRRESRIPDPQDSTQPKHRRDARAIWRRSRWGHVFLTALGMLRSISISIWMATAVPAVTVPKWPYIKSSNFFPGSNLDVAASPL